MINLTFDPATGLSKLNVTTTIKVGADVPVTVNFATAPGTVGGIELALGSDAAAPATLAYTDTFTQESDTVWTGTLDASDTRLVAFMSGKAASTVNVELVCLLDGERQIAPNVQVTVQQPIIQPPGSSEGGPTYLTDTEVAAAIAAAIAAIPETTVIVPLINFGDAVLNTIFGETQRTVSSHVIGVELTAGIAPTGSDLIVTLVDGSGASLGKTITLTAGTTFARTTFSPTLAVAANGAVRAKLTQIGSTIAGAWLTLNLQVQIP